MFQLTLASTYLASFTLAQLALKVTSWLSTACPSNSSSPPRDPLLADLRLWPGDCRESPEAGAGLLLLPVRAPRVRPQEGQGGGHHCQEGGRHEEWLAEGRQLHDDLSL